MVPASRVLGQVVFKLSAMRLPVLRTLSLRRLRALMACQLQTVACHEAGHVVAKAFLTENFHRIRFVTIIPGRGCMGRVYGGPTFTLPELKSMPPLSRRPIAITQMIIALAGPIAVALADGEDPASLLENEENKEISSVMETAALIATPGWPAYRITRMVMGWTEEMLALPPVLESVVNLSALLLNRGRLDDWNVIKNSCESVWGLYLRHKKWVNRLHHFCRKSKPRQSKVAV